jgi:predicted alpha-1,6-mannanase (GH76 family)
MMRFAFSDPTAMSTASFTKFFLRGRRCAVTALAIFFVLLLAPRARAFVAADADAIFSAYTKAFYFTNADGGFFRATTGGGRTDFWKRAEQLEMVLDVYERSTNAAGLAIFTNVFNGFIAEHGTNWEANEFNDDIMWMVIACARAHQITGNATFRRVAKFNFDRCYARAWSTNLGGGLWWKTSNQSKNACVNGPGAIAACLLFQISGDSNYLAKARSLFEWERAHLFDPESGQVFDNMNDRGEIAFKSFTYNQGTFVGAANFLGDTRDARLAADYTRDVLCRGTGILPGYGQDSDAAGFNGIGVRWIAKFMKDRGLQASYQKWLQANADAAWKCRRAGDNLAWSRWSQPTPEEPLYSWACSSSVVILQVVPPTL